MTYEFEHYLIYYILICQVVDNSLWPRGLNPTRVLCPWNFPGKNTGVGWHFHLQGIFLTQRSNLHLLHLLHWQVDSFTTGLPGKPLFESLSSFVRCLFTSSAHFLTRLFALLLLSSKCSIYVVWRWKLLGHVWLCDPMDCVAYQAPQSMEFSRPEYWSG